MPDNDPGSLDRLHDIAVPPPAPWWPPTPGWYVVGGIAMVLLGLGVSAAIAQWRRNRYRREALRVLDRITRDADVPSATAAIGELLKRVALAAYPRDRVASLTGDAWLAFLDASGRTDVFTRGAGKVLKDVAYRKDSPHEPSEVLGLADVVRQWITNHRC